jgi:polysaccharide export outer membrane protein
MFHDLPPAPVPKEFAKASLPAYTIEPPDILLIDAVRVIPRNPRIEPLDAVLIQFPAEPMVEDKEIPVELALGDIFPVDVEGNVNLGINYGSVRIAGLTVAEARTAIANRLMQKIRKEVVERRQVVVELAETRGAQQIRGEHLVRPDGTVGLGTYGSVPVAGMTLDEAKKAIEAHLGNFLVNPEISIDVLGYNSKVYYVITNFGLGQLGSRVYRLPITGNETVLDAFGEIWTGRPGVTVGGGDIVLPAGYKKRIWIARPVPEEVGGCQILPVDWDAIVECGDTRTNYQLFPGDRLFVRADPFICFDNAVAKVTAPFERIFGFILLGNAAVRTLQLSSDDFGNTSGGFGGAGF